MAHALREEYGCHCAPTKPPSLLTWICAVIGLALMVKVTAVWLVKRSPSLIVTP
jgi:hypothetical protein